MAGRTVTCSILGEPLAVCRLAAGIAIPDWSMRGGPLASVTTTPDEMSIVCSESAVPDGVRCERGWRAIKVDGPLDCNETGILASLAVPLADANVSLFAVSTFDTDYLLVKEEALDAARSALTRAGHTVDPPGSRPIDG